ncbi:DUF4292 domain-containing protein [Polaribacter sp.]|nr:DUF4292 domain-containing protein [Polaribacter sp.]
MKCLFRICFFLLFVTACGTNKTAIDANAIAKKMSARKVARKHVAARFDKKTITAKLKVKFDNGKIKENVSVSLRIIKDEVIWLKATKFITILKVKITPTSVQYYSPFFKNYYEGDFSSLEQFLGTAINFEQLQNLLFGQALQNVKKQKQNIEIQNNVFVLSPKVQSDLFEVFYSINPSHFKLEKQQIVNPVKQQQLDILYPNYKIIETEVFPTKISIKATEKDKYTHIDITFKNVKFNTPVNTSFRIPKNYKRINL